MREINFRAWNKFRNEYFPIKDWNAAIEDHNKNAMILEQYIGIADSQGKQYFVGDIGEFDNGDRFVLKMEDYLEVYVDWIGDPECEDQARDLFRIERARIIGNTNENPELKEG
jgi:hypothetical protein